MCGFQANNALLIQNRDPLRNNHSISPPPRAYSLASPLSQHSCHYARYLVMLANHRRSATVGLFCAPLLGLFRSIRIFRAPATLDTQQSIHNRTRQSFVILRMNGRSRKRMDSEASANRKRNRILTADRRRQNREAQRRYREFVLNELVEHWLMLSAGDRKKLTQNEMSAVTADNEGLLGLPPLDHEYSSLDDVDLLNVYALSWPKEFTNTPADAQFEKVPLEDSALELPSLQQLPRDASSRLSIYPYQSEKYLPSPQLNYLQLQKLSFYAARIQNALHIGLPLFLACKEEEISPWYWHTQFSLLVSPSSTADQMIDLPIPRPAQHRPCFHMAVDIISDLTPTALQRSKPHSMYLDMIPFPIFRDRAITLMTMEPPAFDEEELKHDIENDGLMVWGTGQGSMERSASLVRDRRNWECADWFLKKWRLLVRGSGLDEQSQWWKRMRGED